MPDSSRLELNSVFSYVNDSAITLVMILIFQVLGTKYIVVHKNNK